MDIMTTLASSDSALVDALAEEIKLTIVFGVGAIISVVAIVFGTMTSMSNKRTSEATKRELAAYVAEGSMTPQDAERILRADREKDD